METTEFSSNSLLSKIFFKCLEVAGLLTSNTRLIWSCVSQIVSFDSIASTFISPFGAVYNKKLVVSSLIDNFLNEKGVSIVLLKDLSIKNFQPVLWMFLICLHSTKSNNMHI